MRKIILDTDFSTDAGDAICLAYAAIMHRIGMVQLLGVVVSSSNEKAAGAVSAILKSFGLSNIPVGQWQGASRDSGGPGTWVGPLYDNFPRYVGLRSSAEDGRALYQRLLAENSGVDIVAVGGATSLDDLLTASPSLAASVRELSWMAGDSPSAVSEFNIAFDPAAADRVMRNWPGTIIYSGYTIGTGMWSAGNVRRFFSITDATFYAMVQHGSGFGRDSWDNNALLWTVYGQKLFGLERGSNVGNGNGNTWTKTTAGKDAYITRKFPNHVYVHVQNTLLIAARDATQFPAWQAAFAMPTPIYA